MPDRAQDSTANFCQLRKEAMRLDERSYCDRGFSRAQLAERMGVPENTLLKWLSPSSDREMPASLDALWMATTKSNRLLKLIAEEVGEQLMDPRDLLMLSFVERWLGNGQEIAA